MLIVDNDSLYPGFGPGGSDMKIEAVDVAAAPGLAEILYREGVKLPFFPHAEWDVVAFLGEW